MDVSDALWFRVLAGLLVGLALGSFATMLSYRIPRRLSIVRPPSQCPSCHTPLKPLDLIPVFSWLMQGGRCRHCHKPIGIRYVLVELITTAGSVIAFVRLGFQLALIPTLIALIAFVTLATINSVRE